IQLSSEEDKIIKRAEELFGEGINEIGKGHVLKARIFFDSAIDVFLTSPVSLNDSSYLKKAFEELINRIHEIELKSIYEGDGFVEQTTESSFIDELENIETFPLPPDKAREITEKVKAEMAGRAFTIPMIINEKVLYFIEMFKKEMRDKFEKALKNSGKFIEKIKEIFKEAGVPEDLAYLPLIESEFKLKAKSRANAKGLWQFVDRTGKIYSLNYDWWRDEKFDFIKSTRAAAKHLKDLFNRYNDWYLAIAAYNAGAGKIDRAIKKTGKADFWEISKTKYIRTETKNYVPAFLASLLIAKNPVEYGFEVEHFPALQWEICQIPSPTDLRVIAECAEISLEELKELNPELRRMTTPGNVPYYEIRLPLGKAEIFKENFAKIPEDKRVFWRWHIVKKRETLYSISRKYGVSVRVLREVNSLSSNKIKPEMKLLIPSRKDIGTTSERIIYVVRKGDTLYRIAMKYGTTIKKIKEWNNLKEATIFPGKRLVIYIQ
ncbi:MAG: LysM peptidoglycan-binding domain-containing protein, partial [Candidatus Aminicenantia bacterium]